MSSWFRGYIKSFPLTGFERNPILYQEEYCCLGKNTAFCVYSVHVKSLVKNDRIPYAVVATYTMGPKNITSEAQITSVWPGVFWN